MNWSIPGTVLTVPRSEVASIPQQLTAMFLGGGVVLSQVTAITGLEPYTVQNWVKRGFLPPPEHKRYNMNQLCRIIMISMLKHTLHMEQICGLMAYINGDLDNTADDLIDDARLYFMFLELASGLSEHPDEESRQNAIDAVLSTYAEPVPGARERVKKVLGIMLTAWAASRLHDEAQRLLTQL